MNFIFPFSWEWSSQLTNVFQRGARMPWAASILWTPDFNEVNRFKGPPRRNGSPHVGAWRSVWLVSAVLIFGMSGCKHVYIFIYNIYLCIYWFIYLFICICFFGRYLSECFLDLLGSERPRPWCCERMKSCADCLRRAPPLKTPKFRRRRPRRLEVPMAMANLLGQGKPWFRKKWFIGIQSESFWKFMFFEIFIGI